MSKFTIMNKFISTYIYVSSIKIFIAILDFLTFINVIIELREKERKNKQKKRRVRELHTKSASKSLAK